MILLQRIEKLGQMGDVVKVKPGYARNFLLPQKKALRANKANLAAFEGQRAQLEAQNLKRREEAERLSERMAGLSVVIIRQAGESGSLYGSVSARDISDAATVAGLPVTRRQVRPNGGAPRRVVLPHVRVQPVQRGACRPAQGRTAGQTQPARQMDAVPLTQESMTKAGRPVARVPQPV